LKRLRHREQNNQHSAPAISTTVANAERKQNRMCASHYNDRGSGGLVLRRYFARTVLSLVFVSTAASAQTMNPGLFCNAGLRPNGYIDFAGLPPAPNFPSSGEITGPSVSFTATLPVTGVAGLTVQVTIPSLQSQGAGPIYSVANGTLTLNGLPATSGELLTLQFSNPVAGLGLIADSVGRGSDFTLQTDAPGQVPPSFQNTADIFSIAPYYYSIPLQQVNFLNPQGGFTTAYVLFAGGNFGLPSLSNPRVQSAAASFTTMVPKEGLQQWLISGSVQSPFLGNASSWPDQSGNGHDATQTIQANQPGQVQGDGNACQPAFSFAGNQYFNFNLPIDGWEQMTIFLVGKASGNPPNGSYASNAAAIFWNENAFWGNTFVSPYQTSEPFRFGTTQAGNQPIYSRPVTVGEDFTITRAVHNGSTDSLYVDGLLAVSQGNKLPVLNGTTGVGYIGKGSNNTYFNGEISEILVYNRVLSPDETASVESYLRNKFGTR
jgi:hypothetical protein